MVSAAKAGLLPSGWSSADVGAILPAGTQSYTAETARFDLSGAGSDIGGKADQFHYVYESWSGDGEWVVQVASLQNTNAWAKAGIMIRENPAAGFRHAMLVLTPGKGVAFQSRKITNGVSLNKNRTGSVAPGWLKLVRKGNQFDAYTSSDGQAWAYWMTDNVIMPSGVFVGLAVTSHRAGVLAGAVFNHFVATAPLPPDFPNGWTSQDIGAPALAGSGDYLVDDGLMTLRGAGTDIRGASDQFQFAHQPWSGDVVIIVRLDSLKNTHGLAKAGVMVRASLAPGSAHAAVVLTPGNGVAFQRRTTTDGDSLNTASAGVTIPGWLKIERWGDRFDGFYSTDGLTWKYLGSETIVMPDDVFIGLAVTSHNAKKLTEAVFSHFDYHTTGAPGGLWGEYFSGKNFNASVFQRLDGLVNFTWKTASPASVVPVDNFSVRWTGALVPDVTQSYTFSTVSDDGVRLWVNGQLLIDNWTNRSATKKTSPLTLTAGTSYSIKMEYYENVGSATARLLWEAADRGKAPIAAIYLIPSKYPDADADGIPDYWEKLHGLDSNNAADAHTVDPGGNGLTYLQEYLIATHPDSPDTDRDGIPDIADPFSLDYYNGDTPVVTIIGGDRQSSLAGTFNTNSMDVAVWKSDGTGPLANAPVAFSVTSGGGLLAASTPSALLNTSLMLRTDSDGTAQSYYQQPATSGVTSQITFTAGTGSAIFTTTSFVVPVPANVAARIISPTQILLSWAGDRLATSYVIERQTSDGVYQTVAVVEHALGYLDTELTAGQAYTYRIKAESQNSESAYSEMLTVTTLATGADFPLASLRTWLKADAGVIESNDGVSLWMDQSGQGNNAIQTDPHSRPQLVADQMNGQPVIRFNGTGAYLNLPDLMAGVTEGEIFIVNRLKNFEHRYNGLCQFGTGNGVAYSEDEVDLIWEDFGMEDFNPMHGPGSAVLTAVNSYHASITQEGVSTVRFNGATLITRNTDNVVFTAHPLLGSDVFNEYFNGDIAEVIVFNRALTGEERDAIEAYLNLKYDIRAPAFPDSVPPSAPQPLTSAQITATRARLLWPAATDNIAVTGYELYRDGQLVAVVGGTAYNVTGLTPATAYQFTVRARDAAGNFSAFSPLLSVITLQSVGPTFADADGDGLPDAWEISHGFDHLATDNATDDPDSDGLTNRAEYLAGSDPSRATVFDTANEHALRVIWP